MASKASDQDAALRHRVDRWASKLKVRPLRLRVQRMTRKWGSCSSAGTLTLSSDLAAERDHFQDYVIVHELLHLRVPNHGRLFKALMTAYVPGWRLLEELRRDGAREEENAPSKGEELSAGRPNSRSTAYKLRA